MSQANLGKPPRSVVSIYPPLVILAVALGLGVWAQAYSDIARRFPTVVAVILAALAMIDLWSRLPLPGQRFISAFWGTSFDRREMMVVPPLAAELRLLAWVFLAFGGMAVVGILPALPTFCFLCRQLAAKYFSESEPELMGALACFATLFCVVVFPNNLPSPMQ